MKDIANVITKNDFISWLLQFIPSDHPDRVEAEAYCRHFVDINPGFINLTASPLKDNDPVVKQVRSELGDYWEVRVRPDVVAYHISLDVSMLPMREGKVNLIHVGKGLAKEI